MTFDPDLINGTFESVGGAFIATSCWKLYKDKMVRGVHWIHTGFFASWGYWNLYYYPHLEQWWSFIGGTALVAVNTFWLGQILYYQGQERSARARPPVARPSRQTDGLSPAGN